MKKTLSLLFVGLLIGGVAFGQAQKGTITVTVTSSDGVAVPGATVTAKSTETLTSRTAITDADGVARLAALDPADNYEVTTTLDGFNGARNENVRVRAGVNLPIDVTLTVASISEELVVTAESPLVDVTSATTGQDITLELTESLPTTRSYQDYLQLVPGVAPAVTDDFGNSNPASRSGLNYADIGGEVGVSRDNFYYFEGVNVTDSVQGVAGAEINTEIIQEQNVLTGGLPAEFVGATGLVSNVLTKSGGNELSGSANYYFQDDGLVDDDKHAQGSEFSTYDTAVTLGGPLMRDQLWFFASYRKINREEDVVNPTTDAFLRTVERDTDQVFGKVTWAPLDSGLLTGVYLSDPTDRDGSLDPFVSNSRDRASERGGERYTLGYSQVFGSWVGEVQVAEHNSDVNDIPTDLSTRSDVNTRVSDPQLPISQQQLGGLGTLFSEERGTEQIRGSLEVLLDTGFGDHTVKGGFELSENNNFRDFITTGDGAIYNSLADQYLGQNVTAREVANSFRDVDFNPENASDFNGLLATINSHSRRSDFYALLDTNGDGTITPTEVANSLVYNSTAGNPYGDVNYARVFQTSSGEQFTKSEGTVVYLQDTWQWNKWSANVGIRAEEWEHFATDGSDIYTFDFEIAPRLSLVYDLGGNGRQRLSAYYGRYYDPIRNNMTNFAGSLTGRERHEQVFVAGEWLTYRVRGGAVQADALFAPTTETPYTDEYQLGYKTHVGRNMSFEANLIKRETRDILEDYDLTVYADAAGYGLPINHPDSLFLGLGYFGYDSIPDSNFVIATLAGGERDWEGFELVFRKRMSNHWQALASYNYADGEGNSNSDSNADFQGDVLWLDPRAINQEGTQPGLIEHLFKMAGTYQWDNGLSVGATYRWNSGAIVSRTFLASGRNLPVVDNRDPNVPDNSIQFAGGSGLGVAGASGWWLTENSVGAVDNPDYGLLDLRVAYLLRLGGRIETDFFLDVFNVFDDQAETRIQDLVAGGDNVSFGDGLEFADPRRYYLGARVRF